MASNQPVAVVEGNEVESRQIAVAVVADEPQDTSGESLLRADADASETVDVQEVNIVRKSKQKHIKALVLSCVTAFFFILMLCYPAYPAPGEWCFALFILAYLAYLMEALICVCEPCVKCGLGSSTFRYVSNMMSDKAAEKYLAVLMATAPVFIMNVECYHYETRTRTVSNGNGGTRTETYQAKVVTWRATEHIRYSSWMDRSTQVTGLQSVQLMKLKLEKKLEYADEATYADFERQRMTFRAMNNFDVHQGYSETMHIEGFTSHLLAALNGKVHKNVSKTMYIIVSVFCGTYFYRIWLDKLCHATDVNIRKRVSSVSYESPLVFGFETQGNLNMFLGLTYQNMFGTAHPDEAVARAAQPAINVPVAIPMAQEYVPSAEGAAAISADQLPKTEGAPPRPFVDGQPPHQSSSSSSSGSAAGASSPSAPAPHSRGVSLACPPGTGPGQRVSFVTPEGTALSAVVPQGIEPGQTFVVHY